MLEEGYAPLPGDDCVIEDIELIVDDNNDVIFNCTIELYNMDPIPICETISYNTNTEEIEFSRADSYYEAGIYTVACWCDDFYNDNMKNEIMKANTNEELKQICSKLTDKFKDSSIEIKEFSEEMYVFDPHDDDDF